MRHVTRLEVRHPLGQVGTLAFDQHHRIAFAYAPEWLQNGFDLCPRTLTFGPEWQLPRSNVFEGLHGVFSDSLPDAWGRRIMDRVLKQTCGWSFQEVSPLDRLACIGDRGMGALSYFPEFPIQPPSEKINFDEILSLIDAVYSDKEEVVLDKLLVHGGSPCGARPKVLIARHPDSDICYSGSQPLPAGYEHWMVKFRAPGEHDPPDIGNIEKAYAEMAALAGIDLPETDLISLKDRQCFAVKRFDRTPTGQRVHFLSLAAWAYADHRMPCLDYDDVLKATRILTGSIEEVQKMFRLAVFNILSVNKDDHAKNFAFLYSNNRWRLSPAFDLTFSKVLREHTTSVLGKVNPDKPSLMELAKKHGVAAAGEIIGQVRDATGHRWSPPFCQALIL